MTTRELANEASWYRSGQFAERSVLFPGWVDQALKRLARDLQAAADTGHELPDETLKAARDFLGILVGR